MKTEHDKTAAAAAADKENNPWKKWIALAKQNDKTAALQFFAGVEPLIREFCCIPYYRQALGVNEICSISGQKLTEFIKGNPVIRKDDEAPRVIKTVLRNTLNRKVKQCKSLRSREQRYPETTGPNAGETDALTDLLPADSACEPENRILSAELAGHLEEALKHLTPRDRQVIRGLYYEGKSVKALAGEMQITPQYVSTLRKRSLARLRILLARNYPEGYTLY